MLRRVTVVAALVVSVAPAVAQVPSPGAQTEERSIAGRVVRGTDTGPMVVAGLQVVLHRVSSTSAGPVDSVRTGRDGSYRFRYRTPAGDDAMYIVSAQHAGVAYFTPPIREAVVAGAGAEITVFDSSSTGPPLTVRGRHVVVSPPQDGRRHVVDVFELANETMVTRVPGASPHGTWNVRLPAGLENAAVGQGEVPPDAVQFAAERAVVFAPVSPGLKQVIFTYELPASRSELVLPLDQPMSLMEVLVEGGGAVLTEGALVRGEPVAVSGRQFERFVGRELSAGSRVRVGLPGPAGTGRLRTLVLAAAAAAALALGIVAGRRVPAAPPAPVAAGADPDALAQAIAALDTLREGGALPEGAAAAYYDERRATLKGQLVAALAEIEGGGESR